MKVNPAKPRVYKETTIQQLRSFHETAHLGSFVAAATSLGLATPTIWQQVRALERDLGERLIEPQGRGCRPTEAGLLLAEMIGPLVSGVGTLKRRFQEALAKVPPRLVMATTPRILAEDLPECLAEVQRLHPEIRLSVKEMLNSEIFMAVEAGTLDVGLVYDAGPDTIRRNPWLESEALYKVDISLITPMDHPLARRRQIRPADLRGYPLVNALRGIPDVSAMAILDKAGVLQAAGQILEVNFTATACRYVEMGFGIGLIFTPCGKKIHPGIHERSMARHFGQVEIYQIRKKGSSCFHSVGILMRIIKDRLSPD
jgi:DNA-binding transcriptional LysR family regulator